MKMTNPFPGMNPFLERHWLDVHTKLITYISDALAEQLPPDLNARSEERVTLLEDTRVSAVRADVAIVDSWRQGIPPTWQPEAREHGNVIAAEPEFALLEEMTERWVEISSAAGRVITVIEVLSPWNKGEGRDEYVLKRRRYLEGRANVVEIDLLRAGQHTAMIPKGVIQRKGSTQYLCNIVRAHRLGFAEFYRCPLEQPLPNIRVPLRVDEADAVVALQPLIDRCYRMGSYWNADQRNAPSPAFSPDEAEWVAEQVKAAGLA